MGIAFEELGNLNAAIIAFNNAIRLNPKYPNSHFYLGNVLLGQEESLATAVSAYNKVLELDPNHQNAQNNLGSAFLKQGNLQEAIASYEKALGLNPNNADVHYNLGNAYRLKGDLIPAISSYKRAIQIQPNHASASNNLSLTMLLNGDFEDGWEQHECRFHSNIDSLQPHAKPKCEEWQRKTILIDAKASDRHRARTGRYTSVHEICQNTY